MHPSSFPPPPHTQNRLTRNVSVFPKKTLHCRSCGAVLEASDKPEAEASSDKPKAEESPDAVETDASKSSAENTELNIKGMYL